MRKSSGFVWFVVFILSLNCSAGDDNNSFSPTAKWIAFEQLDENMKIIPAVHGNGDLLGERGIKRTVVPTFRREFSIDENIKEAKISICGLGHYELHINGKKVGDSFLSPGWTYYTKRVLFNTYEITEYLKTGKNAMGVIVGNGFFNVNRERYRKLVVAYGNPQLIYSISITYYDGRVERFESGERDRTTPSPVTFSSIYGGEDYDARLEQPGWDLPGFDDSGWKEPVILTDSPGTLYPEEDNPLKVMETFNVQKKSISKSGKTIYDFGQNASGIIHLTVTGNRGARVCIRPAELLDADGNITQRSSGRPYEWNYCLKGDAVEDWEPRFTYYGFRYAEIEITEPENATQETSIENVQMLHTRNSAPAAGTFSCSNELYNKTFELINWGIKSNMASVATDCPHREKLGWLEQTYLIGPSMHYNFDIHSFYRKIVDDMMDSQLDNGLVPDIAPEYVPFEGGFRDSPEWGSAAVIIPWQLYQWYGDREILEKAYPMMKKYLDYLASKSKDNILDYGLGDWYDLGPKPPGRAQLTPLEVTATSIYFYDLQITAQIAKLFEYNDDLKKYENLSAEVKKAFKSNFYKRNTGVIASGSQTSYAMPLYVGLITGEEKERVLANLVDSIVKNDYALTAGDIGYHFLVRVLSENGRSDILNRMNNRSDRPGYGYQLEKGATALTESWAALPESSNNHMMLGHLMEWFYNGLGGIYQGKNSVAYDTVVIAPTPVEGITWVKCSYRSAKGEIRSDWELDGETLTMHISIPENSEAKVILPEIAEHSGLDIIDATTGNPINFTIDNGSFFLNSGQYEIEAKIK